MNNEQGGGRELKDIELVGPQTHLIYSTGLAMGGRVVASQLVAPVGTAATAHPSS